MNTSATGGFLQPEPGLARSDIERLIGDVIAGITGLPRDLVRERIAVPQADPETGVTWCSFGITKRSESKSQVRHYTFPRTANRSGTPTSRWCRQGT